MTLNEFRQRICESEWFCQIHMIHSKCQYRKKVDLVQPSNCVPHRMCARIDLLVNNRRNSETQAFCGRKNKFYFCVCSARALLETRIEYIVWIGNFVLLISWNDWLTVWPMNACMHAHTHWMVLTRDWLTQINYCGRNWMQKQQLIERVHTERATENHPNICGRFRNGNVVKLLGRLCQRIFIFVFHSEIRLV